MSVKNIGTNLASASWWQRAGVRAVKTVAQAAVALIGTAAIGLLDVDWVAVASGALLAGVVSLLTSLAGIPEVTGQETVEPEADGADTEPVEVPRADG